MGSKQGQTPTRCWIGTSGYSYNHWKGKFYPEKISGPRMLTVYAETFPAVEINYSFYHLPKETTIANWCSRVPERFRFILKAGKPITHQKKLLDVEELLEQFCARARQFGSRLGPILYQLPPSLHFDPVRLESFCRLLPGDLEHTVEFRHNSWFCPETYEILQRFGVCLCAVSAPRITCELRATAPFVYLRMHGTKRWYSYNYTEEELRSWATKIKTMMSKTAKGQLHAVYIFFNNDFEAYAPHNALQLIKLLGKRAADSNS